MAKQITAEDRRLARRVNHRLRKGLRWKSIGDELRSQKYPTWQKMYHRLYPRFPILPDKTFDLRSSNTKGD